MHRDTFEFNEMYLDADLKNTVKIKVCGYFLDTFSISQRRYDCKRVCSNTRGVKCKVYSLLILRGYLDYKHVHLHLYFFPALVHIAFP